MADLKRWTLQILDAQCIEDVFSIQIARHQRAGGANGTGGVLMGGTVRRTV
ncbi:hypothetical protein [Pusillimonas sp.]|uniref:hypothetical protein n=1 Tax=Pusillimonas sp. TaxID=3040095 RepID=UPI0037CB4730